MGKAYSLDLRERVVLAVEEKGQSCREAAAGFGVAASTAIKWVKRKKVTGSVAPGPMGGHKPKTLRGEHRDWLIERRRTKDFTLRGLVAELAERGLKVDYRLVWEFIHAEKLTYKKKPYTLANKIVLTLHEDEPSGSFIKRTSIPLALCSLTKRGPKPTWRRCGAGRRADNGLWPRRRAATGTR
jgi:transposase